MTPRKCPICDKHTLYPDRLPRRKRRDPFGRKSTNQYECRNCGYIPQFLPPSASFDEDDEDYNPLADILNYQPKCDPERLIEHLLQILSYEHPPRDVIKEGAFNQWEMPPSEYERFEGIYRKRKLKLLAYVNSTILPGESMDQSELVERIETVLKGIARDSDSVNNDHLRLALVELGYLHRSADGQTYTKPLTYTGDPPK
jgi:hypothetical protein